MGWTAKGIWRSALLILCMVFCYPSVFLGQPETVLIDNSISFQSKQRSAVPFNHGLHMETIECLSCHHRYENGKNVLDESELEKEVTKDVKCVSCHNQKTKTNLKEAFHHQCMGCHMNFRKTGRNSGPELCGHCHPKR